MSCSAADAEAAPQQEVKPRYVTVINCIINILLEMYDHIEHLSAQYHPSSKFLCHILAV